MAPRLDWLAGKTGLIAAAITLLVLGLSLRERANPWVLAHAFPGPEDPKIYVETSQNTVVPRKMPVDFAPESNRIAFGRNDLTLEVRDLETGALVQRLGPLIQPGTPGYQRAIPDLVQFTNAGNVLVVFEERMWESESPGVTELSVRPIPHLSRGRHNILFSPDNRHLLGYNREGLVVIDIEARRVLHQMEPAPEEGPFTQRVLAASISPDGKSRVQVLPASMNEMTADQPFGLPQDRLSLHDMKTGETLWEQGVFPGVTQMHILQGGRSVILERGASLTRTDMSTGVEVWMPFALRRLHSIPEQTPSHDGRFVVNRFDDVWLTDMEKHRPPVFLISNDRATHTKWLDDDRLFILSPDSTARVMRRRRPERFGLWVLPETWLIHGVCLLAGIGVFDKLRRRARPRLHPGFAVAMGGLFVRTFWNAGGGLVSVFSWDAYFNRASERPLMAALLFGLIFCGYCFLLVLGMQGGDLSRKILIGLESLALLVATLVFAWGGYAVIVLSLESPLPPFMALHGWIVELPETLFILRNLFILLMRATVLTLLIKYAPRASSS